MSDHAYRTDDLAVLAAHRAAVAARTAFTATLAADILDLGAGPLRPLQARHSGGPVTIAGFQFAGSANVPWGWRVVSRSGQERIEPKVSGSGSSAAKRWLAEHQPGEACDPHFVLKPHGIAYQSRVHFTGGRYNVYFPSLFEYDDALWLWYQDGVPEGDFPREASEITWARVPITDMHTAYAAAHEAVTARIKETV